MLNLSCEIMAEAEVALRLAAYLSSLPTSTGEVDVSLDGAQIKTSGAEIFPLAAFLEAAGWTQLRQVGKNPWQGTYANGHRTMRINCRSGIGDVVGVVGARRIRAECKKGPLVGKAGNPEYPRLREALGQILTVETIAPADVLVAAVPDSPKFRQLAATWLERPLVKRVGVKIALVARDGSVRGLEEIEPAADASSPL
jgi:hypothetical protein